MLDLEGLWTRYEDPEPLLAEIASLDAVTATRRMQEIYAEEIKPDLIAARVKEIRDAGVTVAGALTRSARSSSGGRSSTPAWTCSSSEEPR